MRVLIADDEPDIVRLLVVGLSGAGFETMTAADGLSTTSMAVRQQPDLVLLDWMLPDISGIDVVRRLRANEATRAIRIAFVTARASEADRILAFAAGADDYVTKPFFMRELVLRCRALVRSIPRASDVEGSMQVGPLRLDPLGWRAWAGSAEVSLTRVEFKLLEQLMSAPEKAQSREALLKAVWQGAPPSTRTVDMHIARLRERLHPHGAWLQTVRGIGYRLSRP